MKKPPPRPTHPDEDRVKPCETQKPQGSPPGKAGPASPKKILSPAQRVAFTGLLFALALALSWLESTLVPLLGLPPGVKIGLANIVVLYALLFTSRWQAAMLVLLKAGFALLVRGAVAGLLSLAGGLCSLGIMLLLLLPKRLPSVVLVSVAGALFHNLGQWLVVLWWFDAVAVWYLPVLAVAGIVMGMATAASLRALLPALQRVGGVGHRNDDD